VGNKGLMGLSDFDLGVSGSLKERPESQCTNGSCREHNSSSYRSIYYMSIIILWEFYSNAKDGTTVPLVARRDKVAS
jgi:hypothetical protein